MKDEDFKLLSVLIIDTQTELRTSMNVQSLLHWYGHWWRLPVLWDQFHWTQHQHDGQPFLYKKVSGFCCHQYFTF